MNIIDDIKESSGEKSKGLYLDAAANAIATYNMKNSLVDLCGAECTIVSKDDKENNIAVGDLMCNGTHIRV